jgi:hypothetical protein
MKEYTNGILKNNLIYKLIIFAFILILFQNCGDFSSSKKADALNDIQKEVIVQLVGFKDKLICADASRADTLIADRSDSIACEQITMIYFKPDIISLKAVNKKYISFSIKSGNFLIANQDSIENAGRLILIKVDSSHVAFKTQDGKYVSADQDFHGKLVANRPWIGDWETFKIIETVK